MIHVNFDSQRCKDDTKAPSIEKVKITSPPLTTTSSSYLWLHYPVHFLHTEATSSLCILSMYRGCQFTLYTFYVQRLPVHPIHFLCTGAYQFTLYTFSVQRLPVHPVHFLCMCRSYQSTLYTFYVQRLLVHPVHFRNVYRGY